MPLVDQAPIELTTFGWVPPFARGQVRDLRVRWALEEAGLDYSVRTVGPIPPGYEREQPFCQVPAYREGDLQLFESGAIVQHIGDKDERLLPRDPVARARAIQWSYSALNSVEPWMMGYATLDAFYPGEEWAKLRKPSARSELIKRLGRVADWLGDNQWLEGDRFSIGDLLMIAVLRITGDEGGPVAEHSTLNDYRARGIARPAFQRALADQLALYADKTQGRSRMSYVDGFILPLHPDKHDAYKGMAETFAREAAKLGGVSIETLGDGLEPGKLTSFPQSVHAQEGENVVFSFVIWPDKATRDAGWEKIMGMPELMPQGDPPFDGKRMFWGGFNPLVGHDALDALLASAKQPAAEGA